MSNHILGGVLRSSDLDGWGTDPMTGASAVEASPAAAPAESGVEGTDPFAGAGTSEETGTDPFSGLTGQAPQAAPGGPALKIAQTQQGAPITISDEDLSLIGAKFSSSEQEQMIARFGPEAVEYMKQQAMEYIGQDFGNGDAPDPRPAPSTAPANQNAAASPLDEDDDDNDGVEVAAPKGKKTVDAISFMPTAEALKDLRDTIGDTGYTQVVRPLLKQVQALVAEVRGLRAHSGQTVQHFNNVAMHNVMDRLAIKDLGNNDERLTKAQVAMRQKTMEFAQEAFVKDPQASVKSAILTGYNRAKGSVARVAATTAAAQRQGPGNSRAGNVGVVPTRATGGNQRAMPTQRPQQGNAAAIAFLEQGFERQRQAGMR